MARFPFFKRRKDDFEIRTDRKTAWVGPPEIALEAIYIPLAMADGQVGFCIATPDNSRQEFLYMAPSNVSDDGIPNVFVFQGPDNNPNTDRPVHHYVVLEDGYDDAELIVRIDLGSPAMWRFSDVGEALIELGNKFNQGEGPTSGIIEDRNGHPVGEFHAPFLGKVVAGA